MRLAVLIALNSIATGAALLAQQPRLDPILSAIDIDKSGTLSPEEVKLPKLN